MASFCKQCSKDIFGQDFGDFKNHAKPGQLYIGNCEGCGRTVMDHTGMCVNDGCLEKHGLDLEYGYVTEDVDLGDGFGITTAKVAKQPIGRKKRE